MEHIQQDIHIPDNIAKYLDEHDGVNFSYSINRADGDYGYAHMTWYTAVLSILTRTCIHCGYDHLWHPNDDDSKCKRHTYGTWRYDPVFAWSKNDSKLTLEEAFEVWESNQMRPWGEPVRKMVFGRTSWK